MKERLHHLKRREEAFLRGVSPLKWLFIGKDGHSYIVQWPNIWLWLALIAAVPARVLQGSAVGISIQYAHLVCMLIWGLLEAYSGDSRFRRLFGLGIIIYEITALFR